MENQLNSIASVLGWVLAIFIASLEAAILWLIIKGKIDLERLISDENGEASLSRFQFMVFTFVIAMGLFLIIVANADFPQEIPGGVLALLGISGGSYVISKGIQSASKK